MLEGIKRTSYKSIARTLPSTHLQKKSLNSTTNEKHKLVMLLSVQLQNKACRSLHNKDIHFDKHRTSKNSFTTTPISP